MDKHESIAEKEERLICKDCGLEVYQCRECDEYIDDKDIIYCLSDRHICKECFDDWQDSELKAKQQLKQGEI